jgi:uncharacterized membrane protein
MPKQTTKKEDEQKIFAFLATFLSIVGFVIALAAKRDDKYVMFYAKQSLVIFIVGAVAGVIASVLRLIPIIGTIIYLALGIVVFVIWLLSWIYALSGKMQDVPIIGDYAKKFEF